jgi:hypothetical protein
VRHRLGFVTAWALVLASPRADAQPAPAPPAPPGLAPASGGPPGSGTTAPEVAPVPASLTITPAQPLEVNETTQPVGSTLATPAPEAPPIPPRTRGLVIESRVGALAFLGDFKTVAPTAPWIHMDVGYEFLKWLAVFGYGELAFTDTNEIQGQALATAFPIYGFGGGLRVTIPLNRRVAVFGEGNVGAMRADVPKGTLVNLGFGNAETFGLAAGGRLGVEWYQIDRHLAFGLDVGVRDALGFAQQFSPTGPPLMLDASLAVRYTFSSRIF